MRRSQNRLSLLLAAGLAFAGLGITTAAAPDVHSGSSNAAKTKAVAPSRDQANKGVPKSGDKTVSRGAGDTFHVDNHTHFVIDIYVDGHYKGTVSDMGDIYINDRTGGEYTAEGFAPGTDLHWGPRHFTTPFTWKLYN
jgi:hypothetical protein